MSQLKTAAKAGRLVSLDALRGFNMFWIIGAERIADALSRLNFPGANTLSAQLNHAPWIGFTFYDLIYPMFIFVVGISAVLAVKRRQEKGESKLRILRHILTRTVLLFILGLYMSNSGLNWYGWLHNLRWMGVLQRIALCYAGAAVLVLYCKPRYQAFAAGALLIGYWLLLRFVPVPGFGAGVWNPQNANFASYFDSLFLPGRRYYHTWDVEGLLSTLPALATCLLGVLTGHWLRGTWQIKGKAPDRQSKALILALVGLVTVGLSLLWGLDFPIIKKIWTSSYALLTGGLSAIFMAAFYWLIDVKGFKKWAFPFVVIGYNSIFVYLAVDLIPFNKMANWVIGSKIPAWFGEGQALFSALAGLALVWLVLYTMYRRKIFIRL